MLSKEYKLSMKIGFIFKQIENEHEEYREITEEWLDSEQLAELAEIICTDEEKKNKITFPNSDDAKITVMETIREVENKGNRDHGYDDYSRGIIAGQIFGDMTIRNIQKAIVAEELWDDLRFGYYQEVCDYVEDNT